MMRLPAQSEIHAAELKVELGARNTLDDLARANAALRATLARPATLAVVAGVSGLLGFWVAQRRVPRGKPLPARAPRTIAGLAITFLLQYAMRHLPLIVEHVSAARKRRAVGFPAGADARNPSFDRPL